MGALLRRLSFPAAALLVTALTACDPQIPRDDAPPERIVAQFDPSAATPNVPRPNDLAISATTGLVEVPDAPDATEADKAFNRYLRTLDGFPTAATASVTFSEPLDPGTVTADTVRVYDVTSGVAVAVTDGVTRSWNEPKQRLEIKAPWEKAHRYAIIVRGWDPGVKGVDGKPVIGSKAFVLLRAKSTLVTCTDLASADCQSATTLISGDDAGERAVKLERARLALKPALDALEAEGISREQLAVAWTFSTVRAPLATFDPANEVVPFPNELLMKDGQVNLPESPTDDAQTLALKGRLNQLDGFSTTASLITETGGVTGAADARLDAATLDPSQFLLVNLKNPDESVDLIVTCRDCGSGTTPPDSELDQVALRPAKPLRSRTPYAAFWLKGAKGLGGATVGAGSVFALTRLQTPVVVEGKSQLDAVDDVTATLLEPLRARTQELLEVTDAKGIAREDVLLAWTFRTQTTVEPLPAYAALPKTTWMLPTALTSPVVDVDLGILATLSGIFGADFSSKLRPVAKEANFVGGNALDEAATETLGNGAIVPTEGAFTEAALLMPRREEVRFTLFLPNATDPRFEEPAPSVVARIPIILFQHGLSGSRRQAALMANTAAAHGYAVIAIDAPMHGVRSFCQSNADCKSGTACVNHRCPGGYKIGTIPGFGPDPLENPLISGNQFVSTSNPFHTRDHFRQAVIDLAQLLRVIKDESGGIGSIPVDDPNTPKFEKLDVTNVRYIGQSLGGIIGTLATASIPEITASTLNVAGASQTDIILHATDPSFEAIKAQLDATLTARDMPPGSQAYEAFIDTARWIMDPADPQNFGRHLIAEPLQDPITMMPMPRKHIFVSWTKGDPVVPNYNTELLLNSIDVGMFMDHFLNKQYPGGDHAFLLNVQNGPFAVAAQEDAVTFIDR